MQCSLLLNNPTFVLIGFKAANFQKISDSDLILILSDSIGACTIGTVSVLTTLARSLPTVSSAHQSVSPKRRCPMSRYGVTRVES